MTLNTYSPQKVFIFILFIFFNTSCSKDSDLFDEYVLGDSIPEKEIPEDTTNEEEEEEEPAEESGDATENEESSSTENKLSTSGENVFYVTVDGTSANDGKTEATSWNLSHALNTARAGDIIHVKAGNYGNLQVSTSNGGTPESPINLVGYKNTPGDIVASAGPSFTYSNYKSNDDLLDANKFPVIQGARTNNTAVFQSSGIDIDHPYWIVRNIGVMYMDYGIRIRGDNVTVDNLICAWMGDFNPNNTYNPSAPSANTNFVPALPSGGTRSLHDNLKGQALVGYGNNATITNSICINGGARGFIMVNSENHVFDYVQAYSDQNINPTDYYILLYGTSNCRLTNLTVKRIGNLTHFGHGISLKCNANNNTYDNVEIFNTNLELNINCTNNVFNNFEIVGGSRGGKTGGIKLSSGADSNTFNDITIAGTEGIAFYDAAENDCSGLTVGKAANDNTFTNVTVSNSSFDNQAPIAFHWIKQGTESSKVENNRFYNCTFENSEFLFRVDRVSNNNLFENCTFRNFSSGFKSSKRAENQSMEPGVSFVNCEWQNVNFTPPAN